MQGNRATAYPEKGNAIGLYLLTQRADQGPRVRTQGPGCWPIAPLSLQAKGGAPHVPLGSMRVSSLHPVFDAGLRRSLRRALIKGMVFFLLLVIEYGPDLLDRAHLQHLKTAELVAF
jgi:hypothetical protein